MLYVNIHNKTRELLKKILFSGVPVKLKILTANVYIPFTFFKQYFLPKYTLRRNISTEKVMNNLIKNYFNISVETFVDLTAFKVGILWVQAIQFSEEKAFKMHSDNNLWDLANFASEYPIPILQKQCSKYLRERFSFTGTGNVPQSISTSAS